MVSSDRLREVKGRSIREYLSTMGIRPQSERGGKAMYLSPLRRESNASFSVDYEKNVWYDHGTGEGGSIIDLVMKMDGCDFKDAVWKLENGGASATIYMPPSANNRVGITITDALPLQHTALLNYLQNRNIDLSVARQYCREVRYRMNGKPYFPIGFKNDAGGWELRNAKFKGSSAPKNITTFDNGGDTVLVFEGFMDFLSYISLKKNLDLKIDAAVLNSVALLKKAIPFLQSHRTVHAFLDNDRSGRQATSDIIRSCSDSEVVDQSVFYRTHKDLNDYIRDSHEPESTARQKQYVRKL